MAQVSIHYDIVALSSGAVKLSVKTVGIEMPSAVFAIEVLPKSRDPINVNYRFSHVCSISELVEFPAEEDPDMCYFRTDEIEMIFDTVSLAIRTRDSLKVDIQELVKLYNEMGGIEPGPDDPDIVPDVYYEDL